MIVDVLVSISSNNVLLWHDCGGSCSVDGGLYV